MHMLSDDDDDDDIYIGYIGYIFSCEVFCELLHMFSWVIGKLIVLEFLMFWWLWLLSYVCVMHVCAFKNIITFFIAIVLHAFSSHLRIHQMINGSLAKCVSPRLYNGWTWGYEYLNVEMFQICNIIIIQYHYIPVTRDIYQEDVCQTWMIPMTNVNIIMHIFYILDADDTFVIFNIIILAILMLLC